jgi:serine/threonine-protein kinase RsbW
VNNPRLPAEMRNITVVFTFNSGRDMNAFDTLAGHVTEDSDVDIASDMAAVQTAARQLISELEERGVAGCDVFHIRVALDEALANAVKHGNRLDPSKQVHIHYSIDATSVVITISDDGDGFDISAVADPTDEENLTKPGGRGLLMMRSFMTDVRYNDTGNSVTLVKAI